MSFHFSVLYLVIASASLMVAQVPFPNQCPQVTVPPTFDLDAYMGVWYEYTKYPFVFEVGKKCMYATYKNLGNNTVSVVNSAINRFTNNPSSVSGEAQVIAPGQLAVDLSRNRQVTKPNYLVLETDYVSYAVVYSCSNFTPVAHTKIVWILTRERKPSPEVIEKAKKVLDANKLSQRFLIDTVQEGCPDINDSNAVATDLNGSIDGLSATQNNLPRLVENA